MLFIVWYFLSLPCCSSRKRSNFAQFYMFWTLASPLCRALSCSCQAAKFLIPSSLTWENPNIFTVFTSLLRWVTAYFLIFFKRNAWRLVFRSTLQLSSGASPPMTVCGSICVILASFCNYNKPRRALDNVFSIFKLI